MRLHLYLDAPSVVTFDHLPALKGAFHRWTGHNPGLHDGLSLYSFSWLRGGRGTRGGLRFGQGAHWSIAAHDPAVIHEIISGVISKPGLDYGLVVRDARIQTVPDFEAGERHFRVLSPVFIRDEVEKGKPADHLLPGAPRADELLTETLRHKLRQAGLDDAGATVRFDPAYLATAKTKTFQYKAVRCRASVCPVLVSGTAEQLKFAWCVGVGHSTGIGCGCLEKLLLPGGGLRLHPAYHLFASNYVAPRSPQAPPGILSPRPLKGVVEARRGRGSRGVRRCHRRPGLQGLRIFR